MARTLEANAPNSLSAFTVKVIVSGAVTETITMSHVGAEPGTWRGTIAQAGSVGEAKLSYYWNGSTTEAGAFIADISATDGTTSYARDLVKVELPFRNATATQNLSGTKVAGTLGDVEGKVLGGTAGGGTIIGTGAHVLDANGAAVATAASQSIIAGIIDTEVADILAAVNAIKAKTDNLPSDPGDASDIAAALSALSSTLATIATYIDTEVAAIKAKTDRLPSITAGQSGGVALVGSVMSISPASLQQASSQDGSTLLIIRGDTITVPFENLGNISDRVDIFFTIKNETTDADADALVQISEEAGLLRIAGDAPGSASYAEIIVDDENAGDGRILIYPPASGLLSRGSRKPTDIQIVRDPDTNVETFLYRANIVNDVTIRRE